MVSPWRRIMRIEPLEDRRLLATFMVTSPGDLVDGNVVFGSLRWALNQANADDDADVIVFADNITNIALNGGPLTISERVRILGPGPRKLTISQTQNNQRIFEVNNGDDDEAIPVEISGVTLTGGSQTGMGDERRGGAIRSLESLTMIEVNVRNNSASQGGGGIWVVRGGLTMDRSIVQNNFAGLVGGGILVGSSDEDVIPNVTIRNSTITGNTAAGSSDDYPMGSYGGGVFVRNGRLTIVSSTIVRNNAALGGGVAMWGSEPAEVDEGEEPPPPPPPTSFISSSIIVDNDNDGEGTDVESVGMTDDDEMPLPFDPLIASAGYNIIGVLGATMPPLLPTDLPEGTNPQFMDVNEDGEYDLWDFGGSTDVFMPDIGSPAIDAGGPSFNSGSFEQRGRHYSRVFNYTGTPQPIMDIGATERQAVRFLVDELFDEPENEGQTAGVYRLIDPVLGVFQILGYDAPGDFTIREALGFARKNTDSSVIAFSQALRFREFENNPNAQVSPPTILLTLGPLVVSTPTVIEGPTNFILEIDASGNDPTPLVNDGLGSRVFHIFAPTQISNLTLMGGDINNALGGGAILAQADLTLRDMTVKENFIAGDGGAVAVRNGTLDISGTTFKNNIATINGGAVYVFAGTTNISNSTFSGNQANGRGGAIANNNGNLAIRYSTITLNTASTTRGSGLWTLNGAMANTTIHGTIISNNSINDVEFAPGANAKIVSQGYNLVGTGNAVGNFNQAGDLTGITNPMLAPLLNTGGQTETHRPLPGSPIIDAGAPSPPMPPQFDQRGPDFVRVFDGNMDGTARIDIGAYELQSSVFVVSTNVDEDDGDFSYGDLSLREAVRLANENPLFDRIEFDPMLFVGSPTTFSLSGNLAINQPATIQITTSMEIEGPGSSVLWLDGSGLTHSLLPVQGQQRIFNVSDGNSATTIDVTIRGLGFVNAVSHIGGGAIYSTENLTLEDTLFVNNGTRIYDPLLTGLVTGGLHGGAIWQQGASLTINNSTLTGNFTDANDSDGGGVYAVNADVTFFYTTFSGNRTLMGNSEGGGMALRNSSLNATEMTIVGNATLAGVSDGGGVYLHNTTALFEESAIGGNFTAGANSKGGGIALAGSSSLVSLEKNTTLTFNSSAGAQAHGGGAYVGGGLLTINNSHVIQNSTTGQGAFGGAIAVGSGGALNMTGAAVQLNSTAGSGSHGGGVANLSGNVTIRNSTLSANQAKHGSTGRGGAIYSDTNLTGTQKTTILNSTISGNTAAFRGGGVFNADGRLEILHSTITNNGTPFFAAGNGVASQGNAATLTVVQSSIIAGNVGAAAGTGSDFDFIESPFINSFQSLGYNVVGVGNAVASFNQAGDKIGITNPLLGPLANNGGPTQTHALLDGSAAVNAGSPSFNPNAFAPALTTDQRGVGFARVQGGRIDSGAFESAFSSLSADFTGDGRVDGADFLRWQRNLSKANPTQADGDANGDGSVNGTDLNFWRAQYGASLAEAAIAPAVVWGGDEEPLQVAAVQAAEAPTAGRPVDAGLGSVAGEGIPTGTPARPAFRPALPRPSTVEPASAAVFAEWSTSHRADRALAAAPLRGSWSDVSADASVGDEDALFALLGDGDLL